MSGKFVGIYDPIKSHLRLPINYPFKKVRTSQQDQTSEEAYHE
jgi:hypothetical protein